MLLSTIACLIFASFVYLSDKSQSHWLLVCHLYEVGPASNLEHDSEEDTDALLGEVELTSDKVKCHFGCWSIIYELGQPQNLRHDSMRKTHRMHY